MYQSQKTKGKIVGKYGVNQNLSSERNQNEKVINLFYFFHIY